VRQKNKVPPLAWDDGLAALAQDWANKIAADGVTPPAHREGSPYGENFSWGTAGALDAKGVLERWEAESQNYDRTTNTCAAGKFCMHFTQVVWSTTTRVGCGKARSADGQTDFLVCNYNPPGNEVGRSPFHSYTNSYTTFALGPDDVVTGVTGTIKRYPNPNATPTPTPRPVARQITSAPTPTPASTPSANTECDVCKNVQQLTAEVEQLKQQMATTAPAPGGLRFDLRSSTGGPFDSTGEGVFYQNISCNPNFPAGNTTNLDVDSSGHARCGFSLRFRETSSGSFKAVATRLMARFSNVPNGVQVWVSTGALNSTSKLIQGETSPRLAASSTLPPASNQLGGLAQVSITGGAGTVTWEVSSEDPNAIDTASFAVVYAYVANPGRNNLPTPGITYVNGGLAPVSTADSDSRIAGPTIRKTLTTLLFAFATNQLGYDTGIVISNTTLDTGTGLGATPMQGVCTLNYYCGQSGCTSPPAQATTAPIPAGQQLTFTLSGGGNYGIAATPGFQGYIIAQCQFTYARGYAYISAQGALPTSNGASMGYMAEIIEDRPGVVPRHFYRY
jgi:pathogenesis-related protein 1